MTDWHTSRRVRLWRCRTHARQVCWRCVLVTAGFPVEHFVWEKLPGFVLITHALGL